MLGNVGKEAITILCEREKVVLLQPFGNDRRMIRAPAINEFFTCVESVVVWTVPARVDGLVDVTSRLSAAKEFLRGPDMALFRGAYPVVVGDVQSGPGQAKDAIQIVHPGSGIAAISFSGTCYVLAVLVNSYTEVGIVSLQAMEARNDIRSHFLQGMADMRWGIGIIDRRCDVVTFVTPAVFVIHAVSRFFLLVFDFHHDCLLAPVALA